MPFITLTIVALLVSEALKIIVILFQVSKKQTDGTVVSLLIAPTVAIVQREDKSLS